MKPFLDTNVLLYAVASDDPRAAVAETLLGQGALIGVQGLNEFAAVARRKLKMSWEDIADALASFRVLCPDPVPVSLEAHESALRIAAGHGLNFYDALMLAAASLAGCSVIYSEDMHDGLQLDGGLTVRNPFVRQA